MKRSRPDPSTRTGTDSARYTRGSVFTHVTTLSITSAIGLFAIFAVDLVDVLFIAMLGVPELAAAVGFAGAGLFFGAAMGIGLSIATSTLVAQAIGAGHRDDAGRLATHGLLYGLCWTVPIMIGTLVFAPDLFRLIGASGETLELSVHYFRIVGASLPILGLAMAASSLLRSVGDAKLSMWSTLIAGLVNAVLDPILIFGLGLGLTGAAIASVASRITIAVVAIYYVHSRHRLLQRPDASRFMADVGQLNGIALPSLATNLSGPVGAAWATSQMARYGTDAVAAASVVGRLTPVAFAGLYGLSGAIGPVASQNVGAAAWSRVRETLLAAAKFVVLYVLPVSIILYGARDLLVTVFELQGDAAALLRFYCTFIVISYVLFGLQLAANPLFTALRNPVLATLSNILRDLCLGIPLVLIGSEMFGARGVLAGQALGNALAGVIAFMVALVLVRRVERNAALLPPVMSTWRRWHFHRDVVPGIQHRGH